MTIDAHLKQKIWGNAGANFVGSPGAKIIVSAWKFNRARAQASRARVFL
jgi:hypothetical protein